MKKQLIFLLCTIMILGLEPFKANGIVNLPVYPTDKEMFLGAFCAPSATDEDFQEFIDCGFNKMYVMSNSPYNTNRQQEYFKLAKKYGIEIVVACGMNKEMPISYQYSNQRLDALGGFAGISCIDEPLIGISVKATEKTMNKSYDTIYDYILAEYNSFKVDYPDKYFENVIAVKKYPGDFGYGALDAYCENVLRYMDDKDKIICIDAYPYYLDRTGTMYRRTCELWATAEGAIKAKEYNTNVKILYYQSWFRDEYLPNIDVSVIKSQIYTGMVFGYTGFTAFYYNSNWKDYSTPYEMTKNEYGKLTDIYFYNQETFDIIKKFENVYLDFAKNWKGYNCYVGTNTPNSDYFLELDVEHMLTSFPGIKNIKGTQDTLVGYMQDSNGNDGFMISNQSFMIDRLVDTVEIEFNNVTKVLAYINGEGQVINLINGKVTLDLEHGTGALVIPIP